MTVFFDPTNRELLKPEGDTESVPFIIAHAAIRTNDADVVHAWALASRRIGPDDEVVMLVRDRKEQPASASLPVFA